MNKLFKFICSLLLVGICFSLSSCSLLIANMMQNRVENFEPDEEEQEEEEIPEVNPGHIKYVFSLNKMKRIELSQFFELGENNIFAPGSVIEADFNFYYNGETAPEVKYLFEIELDVEDPSNLCNKPMIEWKLDDGAWGTFHELENSLYKLSGSPQGARYYELGTLPSTCGEHTLYCRWNFTESDSDTELGTASIEFPKIYFTIICTQVD